jgi:alkylated DNA repair dioxygenase AlkB
MIVSTVPRQRDLFEDPAHPRAEPEEIPGLLYIPDFIEPEQHDALLAEIDEQPWLKDLQRRVQHYGYKYDYKARAVDLSMRLGDLPPWLVEIADVFRLRGLWSETPDQVIVNEYEPGQGIAPHIDCQPCFTGIIVSLSLYSACVMDFTHKETGVKKQRLLEPRSLLLMKDEARYQWTHGIAKRKTDRYEGRTVTRDRRVSLTFRKVILGK